MTQEEASVEVETRGIVSEKATIESVRSIEVETSGIMTGDTNRGKGKNT